MSNSKSLITDMAVILDNISADMGFLTISITGKNVALYSTEITTPVAVFTLPVDISMQKKAMCFIHQLVINHNESLND